MWARSSETGIMETRDIKWAAAATGGELFSGTGEASFRRISTDSRTAGPGDLFVAIRGERHDGHDFLAEVIGRGVAGVLVRRDRVEATHGIGAGAVIGVDDPREALGRMASVYRSEFDLPVVAVVGSNGKTTTKDLLAAVLASLGPILRSAASFNNDIGVPLTLLGLERHHRVAVVEAGPNHPGELGPLLDLIQPGFGLLTGIGREHLEHFVDLEGVAREEGVIAGKLPADGLLVMNGDSPFSGMIASDSRSAVVRFGLDVGNEWRVTFRQSGWSGEEFDLESPIPDWSGRWRVGVPGRHMAVNAAGVLALACRLGVDAGAARVALAAVRPSPQRLETIEVGGIRILNDCYNANADSMVAALQTLCDLPCAGRRVAVLGDMAELGPASEPAHGEVGKFAAGTVDQLHAVGLRAGITAGAAAGAGLKASFGYGTLDDLIPALTGGLQPGDIVLVKASRSSRLERVTAALVQHFSAAIPN